MGYTVLVIEDNSQLKETLVLHLERQENHVLSASNAATGLKLFAENAMDGVLLDLGLPDIAGTEVLKIISELYPAHPPIIVLTGESNKEVALECLRRGAFDFLEKPFGLDLLSSTLERAIRARAEDIATFKTSHWHGKQSNLTRREVEVVQLVIQGYSNREIGYYLKLSAETIKTHLKKIFKKLNVHNRTSLSHELRRSG